MRNEEIIKNVGPSLVSGGYNLLTGAGVSLDSTNIKGYKMLSGNELIKKIKNIKNVKRNMDIQTAYEMLTKSEVEDFIIRGYTVDEAGESVLKLANIPWKRIWTLNIDNTMEKSLEASKKRYKVYNFTDLYSEYHNEIQIIHLHGYVEKHDDGFVFSKDEYSRVIGRNVPWPNILSHSLISEPFIIAGTNMDEYDISFYFSCLDKRKIPSDRPPSILIEPYPDEITQMRCDKYGLLLYEGTVLSFLSEIDDKFATTGLIADGMPAKFRELLSELSPEEAQELSKSFYYIDKEEIYKKRDPSRFRMGAEITWSEIRDKKDDIDRNAYEGIKEILINQDDKIKFIFVQGMAYDGKTTLLKRTSYDMSDRYIALYNDTNYKPDIRLISSAVEKLSKNNNGVLLLFDNLADKLSWIMYILKTVSDMGVRNINFITTERNYRKEIIENTLSQLRGVHNIGIHTLQLDYISRHDIEIISEVYDSEGFLANKDLLKDPEKSKLEKNPIGFISYALLGESIDIEERMKDIISSIQYHNDSYMKLLIMVCIAYHCYRSGVQYPILAQHINNIKQYVNNRNYPIVIMTRPDGYTGTLFCTPESSLVSKYLLDILSKDFINETYDAFCELGMSLSPYVNRKTIKQQTPEAKLASRLFDYDKVVEKFLGNRAINFYDEMEEYWKWNSRFWQQKALLFLSLFRKDKDVDALNSSLIYAKHAITKERHPYTYTTLASVYREMYKEYKKEEYLLKSIENAEKAIFMQENRISHLYYSDYGVHPYFVLFRTILDAKGYKFDKDIKARLCSYIENSMNTYKKHRSLNSLCGEVCSVLKCD